MATQIQRLALLDADLIQAVASFERSFPNGLPIVLSANDLSTNSPTAPPALQAFLLENEILDYSRLPKGAKAHTHTLTCSFSSVSEGGVLEHFRVDLAFYRTEKKGERRFRITWPKSATPQSEDLLYLAKPGDDALILVNLTSNARLGAAKLAMDWGEFGDAVATARDTASGTDNIYPELNYIDVDGERRQASSQKYLQDAVLRTQIEKYAEAQAEAFYQDLGWILKSRPGKPYDLKFKSAKRELRVEVKGSSATAATIFITKNELSHAKLHKRVELFVVDQIKKKRSSPTTWELSGGRIRRWSSWVPNPESIEALQYRHTVPESPIDEFAAIDLKPLDEQSDSA